MTFLAPLLSAGGRVFTALDANAYADQPALPGARLDLTASADARNQRAMQLIEAKDTRSAEALLRALAMELPAPNVLYNLACMEALNGQPLAAEVTLRRAIDAGWLNERHAAVDPDLATVRQLSAWPELIARMANQKLRVTPSPSELFALIPSTNSSPPGRLAMLLAQTSGRGLTVDEALANLERSFAADGTATFAVGGTAFDPASGAMAGRAAALGQMAGLQTEIDTIAASAIAIANAAQGAGVDEAGNPGQPLFSGTGAGDIDVALASATGLATAPAGAPAGSRDTANLAALLEALGAETGPGAEADALLLSLSSRVAALDTRREGLSVVAASAEAELLRETGVDLDTEAANLVRLQQAFEASSRVIQVAAELFDTLLGLR
jgi:flagellar hook-associated protein 1 FlgK